MQQLIAVFEELEARNVRTYIQSGNVVLQHKSTNVGNLSKKIGAVLRKRYGIEPHVLVMTLADFESAMRNNPFPEAELSPKSLHLGFMSSTPKSPDLEKMQALKKDSERFHLIGRVFYLHAPDGIGKSKLAASSEKLLGVPMTDRNWNTVCRLMELANQKL